LCHKPQFDSAKISFSQDGNTIGSTSTYETLEVRLETQLPGEEPFFVIKTEGWSVNSLEELDEFLRQITDQFKEHYAPS